MRVLVTRPLDDARRTARELATRGYDALLAPLSEIRTIDAPEPQLDGVQAVLATSSNGIRAFAGVCRRRDVPVFAVGANTAATARAAGFLRVTSAEGGSKALAAAVRNSLQPATGALPACHRQERRARFLRELAEAGFDVATCELYEAVAMRSVADRSRHRFPTGRDRCRACALSGKRTHACRKHPACGSGGQMHPHCRVCISAAAAERIRDIAFGEIRIAEKPDLPFRAGAADLGPVRANGWRTQPDPPPVSMAGPSAGHPVGRRRCLDGRVLPGHGEKKK